MPKLKKFNYLNFHFSHGRNESLIITLFQYVVLQFTDVDLSGVGLQIAQSTPSHTQKYF